MLVFTASFILIVIAAFIQTTNWLLFEDTIKPNLALITLIVLALINERWIGRTILILTAALILKFTPGPALPDFIFIGAVVLSIILTNSLPWRQPINLLAATFIGTIIIDLNNLNLLALIYELIVNLLLAFALFTLLKLVYVPKIKSQSNRF